jgi:hypothetical protein
VEMIVAHYQLPCDRIQGEIHPRQAITRSLPPTGATSSVSLRSPLSMRDRPFSVGVADDLHLKNCEFRPTAGVRRYLKAAPGPTPSRLKPIAAGQKPVNDA